VISSLNCGTSETAFEEDFSRDEDQHLARPVERVILTGRNHEKIREDVEQAGLEITGDPEKADVVISYGGDGSLLGADRDYPDLPKVAVRRDEEFRKCDFHGNKALFQRLKEGKQRVSVLARVIARANGQAVSAINDIVVHNEQVTSAIRFRVMIDEKLYADDLVGDGIVAATPFGSSAYYRSITNSVFRVGIGLAFNNSTDPLTHLVLEDECHIQIEITRGPAVIASDNCPQLIYVKKGQVIDIRLAPHTAELWELSTLTCKRCCSLESNRPAGFRHI